MISYHCIVDEGDGQGFGVYCVGPNHLESMPSGPCFQPFKIFRPGYWHR